MLAVAVVVLAFAVLSLLPWWEWSFIDDSGLVFGDRAPVEAHGRLVGTFVAIADLYRVDVTWGLFRPAYWVYVAIVYQFPVGMVHALRVGMLALAVAGAYRAVLDGVDGARRRVVLAGWGACALAANGALFMGLWYPSLQELSGLALVGAGLLARRRPAVLALCWLGAAWFKSPFAWPLLAYGLVLLVRRDRRLVGALSAGAALATLAAAALMARAGHYTNDVANFTGETLRNNSAGALALIGAPAVVLVAGVLVLKPRVDLAGQPLAWALLAGGALYLANLLPWRTDAHYAGPYLYLLTVGALLAMREIEPVAPWRAATALAVPALVAAAVAGSILLTGWSTMTDVTGLRDCVLAQRPGSAVGFNRAEGAARLDGIVRLHRPQWSTRVVYVPDGQPSPVRLTVYIHQSGAGPGTAALMTGPVVCRTRLSTAYLVP